MMRTIKNQKGSAPIIICVVAVLLIALGFGGWRVYSSQNTPDESQTTQPAHSDTVETKDEVQAEAGLKPGEVVKLPEAITLVYVSDLSKLPATVPQSFKDYMTPKLKQNDTSGRCIALYSVKTISTVNIDGGVGEAERANLEPGTEYCGGGAHVVWSYKDNVWQESGFQSTALCETLVKMGIYTEFMGTCYDPVTEDEAPNPVGSIKQLAQ